MTTNDIIDNELNTLTTLVKLKAIATLLENECPTDQVQLLVVDLIKQIESNTGVKLDE